MNAEPSIRRIAEALDAVGLEAVLVGNAAAALQGAPVTTLDFDFMFRKTARNMKKLRALADRLGARLLKPYYPASDLYRMMDEDRGLQVDFMATLHGVRSFEGLRSRASAVDFGGRRLWIADLTDIIRSKQALGRTKDVAVLDVLKQTLAERQRISKAPAPSRKKGE